MNAAKLVSRATDLGLRLSVRGRQIIVKPKNKCPSSFAKELLQHKPQLLDWLENQADRGWQTVPIGTILLNVELPRPALVNARHVVDYIVRQIDDGVGPLCEWCLRRETSYWDQFHWDHEICTYAGARDVACWQLGLSEKELWAFLEDFDDRAQSIAAPQEGDPRAC